MTFFLCKVYPGCSSFTVIFVSFITVLESEVSSWGSVLFVIANCAHVTESYGDLVAVNEVSLGIEGREIQAGRI
jgi:hypothetical protein